MRPSDPLRLALCGEFGTENLGNDGTLDAAMNQFSRTFPDARLTALCVHPEVVAAQHRIEALPMHIPPPAGRSWLPGRLVRKLSDPWWCWRVLKGYDALIVAGTGIVEDSADRRPWQTPWSIFGAVLGARLRRASVVFLDVGVAPATSRAKRLLYGAALRMAGLRTYRDEVSRRAARSMGANTSHDGVYPDLCFGETRPVIVPPSGDQPIVAIGVMAYGGPDPDPLARERFARRYTGVLVELASGLIESGALVRMVIGESNDLAVASDVARRAEEQCGLATGSILVHDAGDLTTVMTQLTAVDAAVVTRYHNIVAGLHAGVPTVAICYGPKSNALLEGVGLTDVAFAIGDLDARVLRAAVDRLLADSDHVRAQITEIVDRYPQRLEQQMNDLATHLGRASATREPVTRA